MIRQPDNLSDDERTAWAQAADHFHRAYRRQMEGDFASAIRDYKISLRIFRTCEAHTFLAWVYSFLKLYELAIEECRLAIEVDPDFGNPYNDIGVYLMELDRPAEAIPWLRQATVAPRYDARVYAYYNLGRVFERLGDLTSAEVAYRDAIAADPMYHQALHALQRLLGSFN